MYRLATIHTLWTTNRLHRQTDRQTDRQNDTTKLIANLSNVHS